MMCASEQEISNDNFSKKIHSITFVLGLLLVGLTPVVVSALVALEGAGALVVPHLLVIVILAVFLGRKRIKAALLVLMIILPWQPFLSMPLASTMGASGVKMLVATKEFYVTAFLVSLYLHNGRDVKWGSVDAAAVFFLGINILYFVFSPADFFARMVSLREAFMVTAFYFIGRLLLFDRVNINWYLKVVIIVSTLVVLFGYVERFLFDGTVWKAIGAGDYVKLKWGSGSVSARLENSLPHHWYTFLGNNMIRRMVGPIGDGSSLSRFLALPILALIFSNKPIGKSHQVFPTRLCLILLFGGALLLTFGRGGQLIVIGGLLVWSFVRLPILTTIFGTALMIIIFSKTALFDLQSGTSIRHIAGFAKGVDALYETPFGHGLGTSGMMAVFYARDITERVEESYFGSLAYQMGVLGLTAYAFFVFTMLRKLFRSLRNMRWRTLKPSENANIILLGFSLAAGIFATSILSNSAIAPISAGLSFIYCGASITICETERSFSFGSDWEDITT